MLPFHGDFLLFGTLEAKLEGRPPLSSLLSSWQTELSTSCQVGAHGTWYMDPRPGAITPQGPQSAAHGFSSRAWDFLGAD